MSIPRHPNVIADREPQAPGCHQAMCCSARDECELNINYALDNMIYLTQQLNKNICIPQQINILKWQAESNQDLIYCLDHMHSPSYVWMGKAEFP